jgi:hypothetical protein
MFIFVLWSAGNKKPATALAIAGFGKIFSYNCLCFHSHDAKLTGLMLPTGQTAVGRHHQVDLFGEHCVHFVGDKKPYLRAFVNGIMEECRGAIKTGKVCAVKIGIMLWASCLLVDHL